MVQLTLTPQEAASLREVLTSYLSDLRMEIAATDAMDYRNLLKEKETFLKHLLQRIAREAA